MPSKLTGMLASARPVVVAATPGTELAQVVGGDARINSALQGAPVIASAAWQSMTPCGLVVPPEDAPTFANAVLALAADPALRERLGAAGYAYAQAHLDREAVLGKFEAELFGLL